AHQIVFPLAVGRVTIPAATVDYAVPVSFSFFSREERYSLKSDSVLVTVLPLPVAGRSTDDPRVVAHGLALDVAIEPAEARVGACRLPGGRYAYAARAAGAAAVARAAPRALAVGQGAEPRAARPLPPLDRAAREAWTTALAAGLMPWGWLVLLVGPPLVAWFL